MTRSSSSAELAPANSVGRRWRTGSIAIALAACAAAAAPLLDRVNIYTLTSPAVVAVLAIWAVWRESGSVRDPAQQGGEASDTLGLERASQRLSRLLLGVLPVWRQHVASAKGQIDDAVSQLVVNFSSITDEFEAAGFKGAAGSSSEADATASLLVLCESDLQQVVSSMNEISNSKGAMAASMHELARATSDLQSMAQGVAQIAAQTNLLAINAAIEAAHAGDSGRGFATIAKEIRVLSQSSAQTASQITDRIERVTAIMNETSDAAAKAETQEGSSIERSNRVVNDVLSHMRTLSADAETMRERGNVIRSNIERLIVGLQFQDRVSQVISVVEGDITRLREKVEGDEPLPEAEQWLEDLKRHYTMREQRQSPASGGTGGQAKAAAPAPRKVVFF